MEVSNRIRGVIGLNKDLIWQNFLAAIEEKINPLGYTTWFKDTELHELGDSKAIVIVPMSIHKKHLTQYYSDLMKETMNDVTGTNFEFEYMLKEEIEAKEEKEQEITDGVPFNNPEQANLNPNYLFDTFLIGESNFFAHAAAVSVAENPGKSYNPLFIYGKSGLGKTHLMHAIGNYILKNSNKRVLYVTSEKFITDFLNLNKRDNRGTNFDYVEYFKDKYRNIDVLIIDDIQFLKGAPATQQEFFHTFNDLFEDNKQIIISSDRSPDDLKELEERLITRFNWGLKVNIYPPDYKLRMDIIRKKIGTREQGKPITNDVLEYIANNFQSDVRQLEGAITRVYAYATMFNAKEIDLPVAIEAFKDYVNKSIAIKNDIGKIQSMVCEHYKISMDEIKSKNRNARYAYPRQVAMYLSRRLTNESYPKIGLEFGGKNHATIIHAFEKIEADMKQNPNIEELINSLISKINS